MRRFAGWMALTLLLTAAGWLVLSHLQPPGGWDNFTLSQPSLRCEARMETALPNGAVDINHASVEELDMLPSVGPVIAQRIIEERMRSGPFHYPEDLLAVNGIGQKTLEKLYPQISIH